MSETVYNLKDLLYKVSRGNELTYAEAKFVKQKYLQLRRTCNDVLSQCSSQEEESVTLRDLLDQLETRKITRDDYVDRVLKVQDLLSKKKKNNKAGDSIKLRETIASRMAMSAVFFHQAKYINAIKHNITLTPELLFQMSNLDSSLSSLASKPSEDSARRAGQAERN